jgi:hypothetical protein
MDVVLVETEGRGLSATIEVDGHPLRVVDAVSAADSAAAPGPIARARFDVVINDSQSSISPAVASDAPQEKKLEHVRGYRYLGVGQIVSIDPVCADLGLLTLELPLGAPADVSVGDRLEVAIDRIKLSRARA